MLLKDFWRTIADGTITEEAKAYAQEQVDKLELTAKAKEEEHEEIRKAIIDALTEAAGAFMTAKEVGEMLDISTQKASYHLGQLAKDGLIERVDGKPVQYRKE